jgi:hypothetical protein
MLTDDYISPNASCADKREQNIIQFYIYMNGLVFRVASLVMSNGHAATNW